jgi:prepilin-type N-terminal cleavage/methylation domain-containing protein
MRKAFTLIELLVVIAIIAILAAILFPVFAQAKAAAKVTSSISGLKQVALGLHMYSGDYDDTTVWEYGYPSDPTTDSDPYHSNTTWVGRIFPYVKNQSIFFDKTIGEITDYNKLYQDPYYPDPYYTYTWAWITSFSLNTDGYSRTSTDKDCNGVVPSSTTARSMTAFENPAELLAATPTRYGSISNWSWMRFISYYASIPVADRYADTFSWYQTNFDARKTYGRKLIGAYADGHAAKYGWEKFVKTYTDTPGQNEANSRSDWCTQMTSRDLWKFWGSLWN